MRQLLFFCTLSLILSSLFAQSIIFPPINRSKYDVAVIDSGSYRVLYAMNAVDVNDQKTYDDLQRLEIGSKLSKYYSYFVYCNDSLKKDFIRKNPHAQSGPNQPGELGKKGFAWSLVVWSDYFKDFSKNTLTEYANMPHSIPSFQYMEEIPVQKWELHEDTLTVYGYLCQKATCRFRGNDFIAWFAPELPISNGPWKFGGLPGLIMKVYDIDNHYVFECIKIESHEKKYPIMMFDEKRYQKTERTKLRKLEKDVHEDFFKVGGWTVTTKGDSPVPVKFTPVPYHPLEFE